MYSFVFIPPLQQMNAIAVVGDPCTSTFLGRLFAKLRLEYILSAYEGESRAQVCDALLMLLLHLLVQRPVVTAVHELVELVSGEFRSDVRTSYNRRRCALFIMSLKPSTRQP